MKPATTASADFEARLARLEGTVEQMNHPLANLERGQRWLIGLHSTSFVTLGTLILFRL